MSVQTWNPPWPLPLELQPLELAPPEPRNLVPRLQQPDIVLPESNLRPYAAPVSLEPERTRPSRREIIQSATLCLMAVVAFRLGATAGGAKRIGEGWNAALHAIQNRRTVESMDDFRGGFSGWSGGANWSKTWSFDHAGFVRPGQLALYRPSMQLSDYRLEFLARIEQGAIGWTFRSSGPDDYLAAKLKIVEPGLRPQVDLERYVVTAGVRHSHKKIRLRMILHPNRPWRVQFDAKGDQFALWIDGDMVETWRENARSSGGIGFFTEGRERAQLHWMKLTIHDDLLGKLSGYLASNDWKAELP